MSVKKIGKAKLNIEDEVWGLEGGREEKFMLNRRLVDARPDIKAFKSRHSKTIQVNTPSRRKPDRRKEYFSTRDQYRLEWSTLILEVYNEITKESLEFPIVLRREKDYDHHLDWRYCLFKGIIYQFDKANYSSNEMIEQIEKLEKRA